jgi:hypothetical protein
MTKTSCFVVVAIVDMASSQDPSEQPDPLPPIFIPTAGRPGIRCLTSRLLCEYGVPHTLVVEPRDAEAYHDGIQCKGRKRRVPLQCDAAVVQRRPLQPLPEREANIAQQHQQSSSVDDEEEAEVEIIAGPMAVKEPPPSAETAAEAANAKVVPFIAVLPKDGQGVAYARSYVANVLAPTTSWWWMLDDDIAAFFVTSPVDGKTKVRSQHALRDVLGVPEAVAKDPTVAIFGLEYERYWVARTPPSTDAVNNTNDLFYNSYVCVATCLNLTRVPPSLPLYRMLSMREDYDVVLQLMACGKRAARLRCVAFRAASMGSAPGGMTDTYQKDAKIVEENKKFVTAWGYCTAAAAATSQRRVDARSNQWALVACPPWIDLRGGAIGGETDANPQADTISTAVRALRVQFAKTSAFTQQTMRRRTSAVSVGALAALRRGSRSEATPSVSVDAAAH